MSAVLIENPEDSTISRKFFTWGDHKIMDSIAKSSTRNGTSSESFAGLTACRYGARAIGGKSQKYQGMSLIDQRMDGKQPLELFLGHNNAAILQERFSEAMKRRK